mmetsp:Transcript_52388/g.139480  ORF Transcript_52388/g.139480 Transcript_52388/m.139480 type:complete len:294 (+) Transcript_52388:227-1108(+)
MAVMHRPDVAVEHKFRDIHWHVIYLIFQCFQHGLHNVPFLHIPTTRAFLRDLLRVKPGSRNHDLIFRVVSQEFRLQLHLKLAPNWKKQLNISFPRSAHLDPPLLYHHHPCPKTSDNAKNGWSLFVERVLLKELTDDWRRDALHHWPDMTRVSGEPNAQSDDVFVESVAPPTALPANNVSADDVARLHLLHGLPTDELFSGCPLSEGCCEGEGHEVLQPLFPLVVHHILNLQPRLLLLSGASPRVGALYPLEVLLLISSFNLFAAQLHRVATRLIPHRQTPPVLLHGPQIRFVH